MSTQATNTARFIYLNKHSNTLCVLLSFNQEYAQLCEVVVDGYQCTYNPSTDFFELDLTSLDEIPTPRIDNTSDTVKLMKLELDTKGGVLTHLKQMRVVV